MFGTILATTLTEACGASPGFLCELIFDATGNEALADVAEFLVPVIAAAEPIIEFEAEPGFLGAYIDGADFFAIPRPMPATRPARPEAPGPMQLIDIEGAAVFDFVAPPRPSRSKPAHDQPLVLLRNRLETFMSAFGIICFSARP